MNTENIRAEVLQSVTGLIQIVIGEDWADELEIGLETSFNTDLELESIEFVALAEALQERYGSGVGFVDWIASMELDDIIGLKVGDLVEFICQCITSPPTE